MSKKTSVLTTGIAGRGLQSTYLRSDPWDSIDLT